MAKGLSTLVTPLLWGVSLLACEGDEFLESPIDFDEAKLRLNCSGWLITDDLEAYLE